MMLSSRLRRLPPRCGAASQLVVASFLRRTCSSFSSTTTSAFRSHTCGELRDSGAADSNQSHIGQQVVLSGWVDAVRPFGPISFINLRDRYGITQLVVERASLDGATADVLQSLRPESVLQATGVVRARPESMRNPQMPTGNVEVLVQSLHQLNAVTSSQLPLQVATGAELASEETRLRHRYLDLRRSSLQQNLILRSTVAMATRNFLCDHGFLEIETPTLFKSTPEGAREFLVPTRSKGLFYALTQSPQQYKQLLMVGGLDKYFQLARCYRDEGGRADRQPEFTQIDIEMAFIKQENLMGLMEEMVKTIWKKAGKPLAQTKFPRMKFQEAIHRFGVDKPDTRYKLELEDVADLLGKSTFLPFQQVLALPNGTKGKGTVRAINVKQLASSASGFSRKEMDELLNVAKRLGGGGLTEKSAFFYAVKVEANNQWKSSLAKQLTPEEMDQINTRMDVEAGDVLLLCGGAYESVTTLLGRMRSHCAQLLLAKGFLTRELSPTNFNHLWVVDFPMFERNDDGNGNGLSATHHPFTAPTDECAGLLDELVLDAAGLKSESSGKSLLDDPVAVQKLLSLRAQHYDLVCNGWELGGGSIRLHNAKLQQAVFEDILDLPLLQRQSFEHLLQALSHGAPPHGGIALGLDRLVAILCGAPSLRDVIAFPKSSTGNELMTNAPGPVMLEQLQEYHIQLLDSKPQQQD